ncbi:MAG: hypothetical protein ACJ71R_07255 [Nitrososphaeraceae archaeon]
MHLSNITIDVDGSPYGYVAWYNHYTMASRIRMIHPVVKNDKFAVQRMEMLAIYFAITDNSLHFANIMKKKKMLQQKQQGQEQLIIDIRSDSKSTIEQLHGLSEIRNIMLQRIYRAIKKLLNEITFSCNILFNYLERTRNVAGLMLSSLRRYRGEGLSSKINVNWRERANQISNESLTPLTENLFCIINKKGEREWLMQ